MKRAEGLLIYESLDLGVGTASHSLLSSIRFTNYFSARRLSDLTAQKIHHTKEAFP